MENVSFGDCVTDENELLVHPGKVRLLSVVDKVKVNFQQILF